VSDGRPVDEHVGLDQVGPDGLANEYQAVGAVQRRPGRRRRLLAITETARDELAGRRGQTREKRPVGPLSSIRRSASSIDGR